MGCQRASVLRLSPVGQAAAMGQRSLRSAVGPNDAEAWEAVAVLARSRKRSGRRWAPADPLPVNRPPPLCPPSLPAGPGYTPSRHPILPASAAPPSLLLEPPGRERSRAAQPPLAAAQLAAYLSGWSAGGSLPH